MLMLTHTWMLRMFLGADRATPIEPDLFVHNISPDLLPTHREFSTDATHGLERFRHLPPEYNKAAFTQFHLLVDDIAHYGKIQDKREATFNPRSAGYAYHKGRELIEPIMAFHEAIGFPVTYPEAAYRSHIVIEMAVDQVLQDRHEPYEIAPLFFDSLHYTVEERMDDFCRTAAWLYGMHEDTVAEALRAGVEKCAMEGIELFASSPGRLGLYIGKFGLKHQDSATWAGLERLLWRGMAAVSDYEDFLQKTIQTIREAGFTNPL